MIIGSLLVKSLLKDEWNKSNTGNRLPIFNEYYEKKRANGFTNQDEVLIYNRITSENPSSVGNTNRKVVYRVSVDLRTDLSQAQVFLMQEEVKRIIHKNVNYIVPAGKDYGTEGEQCILEIKDTTPFSNSENTKLHKNFRIVMEINITCNSEAV